MTGYSWYVPHMLAAYMDFGIGILIAAHLWTHWWRETPSFWTLFLGGALALLPDFDIVVPIFMGHVGMDHHQLPTHFPAVMLVIPPALLLALWGWRYATLGFVCILWHFIHDSPPLGGGIAWLWPYSSEYVSLTGAHIPRPPLGSILPMWGRPTGLAIFELTLGSVALILAARVLLSLRYMVLGGAISACVWLAALMLWFPRFFARFGIVLM